MSRLKDRYLQEVKPALQKKFGYKNVMCIPALKKVVISMGVAVAIKDKNILQESLKELSLISGQKPVVTKAKKSIANFKSRIGQGIGCKVTLRGKRMYDFVDRLIHIVFPRIRDFRGFKRKGDGDHSYSLGISDQQVFPEIDLDEVKREQGMNITFVTNARGEEECLELLSLLKFPFRR